MAFFSKWFSQALHLPPKGATSPVPEIEPNIAKGHILVVDDEPNIVRLMKTPLEARGYTVESASNGKEALEIMRRNLPDLLVTDIMMPEMDGFELIISCTNDPELCDVLVIALTALSSDQNPKDLNANPTVFSGVDFWLTKPFNPQELVKAVGRLLNDG